MNFIFWLFETLRNFGYAVRRNVLEFENLTKSVKAAKRYDRYKFLLC